MFLQAVARDVEVEDEDMRQRLWKTAVSNLKLVIWRSCRRQSSAALSFEAAGDDAHVYIEHVVEVDPQVEQDPTMEGEREMETSFGKVANESSGHHELWFNAN